MRRLAFVAWLLITVATAPVSAALHAYVDSQQVPPGSSIELTLSHDGRTNSQPDLSPLQQDFNIVGRSTSSSLQITNGSTTSSTQLTLTLSPKRSGHLVIPAIAWDADRSEPLSVDVAAAGSNGAGSAASGNVFVETQVDQKSPYLQAAVHVTTKVYTAVALSQASLDFPDSDAAVVRQAGQDVTGAELRNGRSYRVIARHYLLFPQHSGHLIINGPALSANVAAGMNGDPSDPFARFGGMFGMTRPMRLNGEPITLDVQPRPAGVGSSYWLPAQQVELGAKWSPEPPQGHVGDPLTVTLHLTAQNLTAAQLPDLSALLSVPTGLKAYPDQPRLKDVNSGTDLIGQRDQSIALIADQPGHFTIPELRLSWWDTHANQQREVVVAAQTLVIDAAPGAAPLAPVPAASLAPGTGGPSAATNGPVAAAARDRGAATIIDSLAKQTPWMWVSLAFALLWLLTSAGWLLTRSRRPIDKQTMSSDHDSRAGSSSRSSARAAFLAACSANDAEGSRRSLLAWARAERPDLRIPGLGMLATQLADPTVSVLLRELDRACYKGGPWEGAQLAQALEKWPAAATGAKPSGRGKLAPLYD